MFCVDRVSRSPGCPPSHCGVADPEFLVLVWQHDYKRLEEIKSLLDAKIKMREGEARARAGKRRLERREKIRVWGGREKPDEEGHPGV